MSDIFDEPDDAATLLTADEKRRLIPDFIMDRRAPNEAEQENIFKGRQWAFARDRDILNESVLRELHRRMFNEVWEWAGEFRTTERNIGVDAWRISTELRQLLDDTRYQIEHESCPPDEIAARFHFRLVSIYPFPNGNGRCGRLAADMLARQMGQERFSWGGGDLTAAGETRRRYIEALRSADRHEIGQLLAYMRLNQQQLEPAKAVAAKKQKDKAVDRDDTSFDEKRH